MSKYVREKEARREAEQKQLELEERLKQLEEENLRYQNINVQSEVMIKLLQEQVGIAEEEARALVEDSRINHMFRNTFPMRDN